MDDNLFDKIDASNIYSDVEPDDIHGKVLVGSYIRLESRLAYASGLDGRTFLQNSSETVHQYLLENCIFKVRRRTFTCMRILKVIVMRTGEYEVIDKTYWIRLIQRCWRSRLAIHKANINKLDKKYLYYRELHGNYPGLKGKKLTGILAGA
jgi:hypothetical protein